MAQGGIESSAPVKNNYAFKNPTGLSPKRELTLTFISVTVPPVQMNVACDTELHKNFHKKRANFLGEFFLRREIFRPHDSTPFVYKSYIQVHWQLPRNYKDKWT